MRRKLVGSGAVPQLLSSRKLNNIIEDVIIEAGDEKVVTNRSPRKLSGKGLEPKWYRNEVCFLSIFVICWWFAEKVEIDAALKRKPSFL